MPLPPETLNQALNQLPQLLLSLGRLQQDRRDEELRRDIQQASQEFQAEMLTKRIAAEKELTEFKAGLKVPEEPPEVSILGRRIEKDLDILRDPNTALTFGESDINAVKNRIKANMEERKRLSGRDYPVDPSLIRIKPKPKPVPEPLPAPPVTEKKKPKPRLWESRPEYQKRLSEWEGTAAVEQPTEVARPTTQAEYDALPSGSNYLHPVTGEIKTKP